MLASLAPVFYSCKSNSGQTDDFCGIVLEAPMVNAAITDKPVYSDYIVSADTIMLESTELESYVYFTQDLIRTDKYIFILSRDAIYMFDYQGKYIRKIHRIGRGPGEFLSIKLFDIQEEQELISIYDSQSRSMLIYTFKGEFIRKFTVQQYIAEFAVLSNGHYLFFNYDDHFNGIRGLYETDENGNVIKNLYEIPDYYNHIYHDCRHLMHINKSMVSFLGLEDCDIVFHFENDSLYPTYKFKTDITMPREIMEKTVLWQDLDKEYSKISYFESDKMLGIALFNIQKSVTVFYDKEKEHIYRLYPSEWQKDESVSDRFPYSRFTYNGRLSSVIERDWILEDEDEMKNFPGYTAESNPVVIVYNTK